MSLTSHQIASIAQSSIKGPATFNASQSCHKKKYGAQSKTQEGENVSPYKVQDAIHSILEKSGGDLEKASQLLDERLSVANRMIRELSESGDSLSHEEFRQRMRLLKSQHRNTVEMTEDLRAAARNGAGRSVAFDDSKKPPLPPSAGHGGSARRGGQPAAENNEEEARAHQEQQEQLRSRVKALWSDFDVHNSRSQRPRRSASLDRGGVALRRPGSAASAPGDRRRHSGAIAQFRRRRGGSQSGGASDDDRVSLDDSEFDDFDDGSSWRHRVTIPRPFSMTLREEAAADGEAGQQQQLRKSRSMRIVEADVQRQREAQEAECRVRPRAAPVPAHVYQPLLRELEQQREERRRQVREHSAELLRATERPFSFTKREAERKRQGRERATEADKRRGYHRSASGDRESTVICAKPAPASCSAERARQLRAEAELRREQARARSEANLRRAALPGNMAQRQRSMEARRDARLAAAASSSTRGQSAAAVGRDVPDFDRLHRQFELGMLERQAGVRVTRPEPFRLLTQQRAKVAQEHTEKCLASDQDPKANRTLYDFSLRYPTDPADEAESSEAAATEAAAERERQRQAELKRFNPEGAYQEKLRELDRKMKERDLLIAEQSKLIAQQNACARYRQSLLQAGVEPARIAALVRAYRERELATFGGAGGDDERSEYFNDGFSSVPNESEMDDDEQRRGMLDETRFGAPSPVPPGRSEGWKFWA
ncbi:hypothetical protein BOX15_Mlig008764g1 [Macrostomum lignano]|uniref:Uncharacterized protein n=1 Tax=Macrostomum lignano TaxID=282301 RepID=A0A267EBA3_9PLAT|nr:hypothetical protein BOX15_Mlig008764g1 [Macrostomum lignano]